MTLKQIIQNQNLNSVKVAQNMKVTASSLSIFLNSPNPSYKKLKEFADAVGLKTYEVVKMMEEEQQPDGRMEIHSDSFMLIQCPKCGIRLPIEVRIL